MAKYKYASDFSLKKVTIEEVGGGKTFDITDLVVRYDYFENIYMPTVSGKLQLVDKGNNLIASLPIQGFEKVQIELEASDEETYEYDFRVYKVSNRFGADRFQTYTLHLISEEALINEGIRVSSTLKGKADQIVADLLLENLKTKKEVFTDASLYNVIFNPGKKTPFSIIDSLRIKTVSDKSKNTVQTKSKDPKFNKSGEKTEASSVLPDTDSADYSKVKGSAGYFFYENRTGYHYRSMDLLMTLDDGSTPVAKYFQENDQVGGPPNRKILEIDFAQEIDILTKLRMGAYSSIICYYNYSTGRYEEYVYSLKDSYEKQGHLGSQKGLSYGQKELSKFPTRVMSVLIDHETWYNETDIASPEKADGSKGKTTEFPDFQKYYLSQSISRSNSLNLQTVKITVTGNPSIKVGDKVEIVIPNQVPEKEKVKEPVDEEHSGIYLVTELNHAFSPKQIKSNTYLVLTRDSYGSPDAASKVKT